MDTEQLSAEISSFLASSRLRVVRANGVQQLEIPGHARLPHKAFGRKNEQFHEEAASLAVSFLLTKFKPAVFFDVGAQIGYYAQLAASNVASASTAHAFEMNPHRYEEMVAFNKGLTFPGAVVPHLIGLSDEHVGPRQIWFRKSRMFEHEPTPDELPLRTFRRIALFLRGDKSRGASTATVQVTTLDQFCSEHNLRPGFLKIDVDGYEGKVLKGAHKLLRQTPAPIVVLELHRDNVQTDGLTRGAISKLLFDAGYSAIWLTDRHHVGQCRVTPIDGTAEVMRMQQTDIIVFMPPG